MHEQKNVYAVFRHDPPSVGFATLSAAAIALNGAGGEPPSPTIGSVAAAVGSTSSVQSGLKPSGSSGASAPRVCAALIGAGVAAGIVLAL